MAQNTGWACLSMNENLQDCEPKQTSLLYALIVSGNLLQSQNEFHSRIQVSE